MKKNNIRGFLNKIKGDAVGGIVSSIMGLPKAIPMGSLVFAPFGPEYIALGTFAGMVSIIFSNFGSAITRGNAVLNSGPFSIPSLMLVSAVPIIMSNTGANLNAPVSMSLPIALIFFVVFASGFFQLLFGLFKVGSIAKYIPYPVIAGLMNGAGLMICLGQVRPMLGLSKNSAFSDVTLISSQISAPNLIVGIVTLLLLWRGDMITRRIAPTFLGLIGGTILFHAFRFTGYGDATGGTIGTVSGGIPSPKYLVDIFGIFQDDKGLAAAIDLIPVILSIALVNSLRSLVVIAAVDGVTHERTDSNKELVGQGLGNMMCSVFGGISAAGSQSTTISGYRNGASSSTTKVFSGFFSLLILIAFTPAFSYLPEVVIAASLIMLGIEAIDSWSVALFKRFISKRETAFPYLDALIVLSVTAISVFIGVFEALSVGIILSVVHFIFLMGKDIVAREYDATRMRSNIIRPESEIVFLEAEGDKIHILELQGALFFGTADKLASKVDSIISAEGRKVQQLIMDFRKVHEIDGTGANLINQMRSRAKKKGVSITLSSVADGDMWLRFEALGMHNGLTEDGALYPNIDSALASAEDHLIDSVFGIDRDQKEKNLNDIPLLQALNEEELCQLARYVKRISLKDGTLIYRQSEPGNDLYFILRGRARVEITPPGKDKCHVIAILCSGMMFGEMAVLDGGPRSADVRAIGEFACVSLSKDDIEAFTKAYPDAAIKLYKGFALTFSHRMRIANRINTELRG